MSTVHPLPPTNGHHKETAPDPTRLYQLDDVSKVYGSGSGMVTALAGVSLTIRDGEFLAIVGQSGSGKTTLLQMLGALDRPSSGRISMRGADLTRASERDLSRLRHDTIGFIFQQFNLIPTLTAQQNVESAMAMTRMSAAARRRRAQEQLAAVGLAHRVSHLPSQMSGGEQQRVAIARALVNHPRVLLADEPTGNLDTATGQEILVLLRQLSADHGQTVILITHDTGIAATAPRVVHLRDGAILADSQTVAAATVVGTVRTVPD